MLRQLLGCLIPLLSLTACYFPFGPVAGNGNVVREVRSVSGMTALENAGAMEVTVQVGPEDSCTLEMEENLLGYIETTVVSGTLVIRTRTGSSLASTLPMRATVTMKKLTIATLTGSGNLDLTGIASNELCLILAGSGSLTSRGGGSAVSASLTGSGNLLASGFSATTVTGDLSGSGTLTLSGRANTLRATLTGSGNLEAGGLTSGDGDLSLVGSGNATVDLSRSLKASLLGSGSVYYSGNPTLSVVGTGSGRVVKR
ncbi:MAG: DUF2807 domain-containing protein [Spirochaetes bacterium]|nr:DUF2807 domain-containing protein [Spirochaetota bacterium]